MGTDFEAFTGGSFKKKPPKAPVIVMMIKDKAQLIVTTPNKHDAHHNQKYAHNYFQGDRFT